MTNERITVHEPLFHIIKRSNLTLKQAILIRTIAVAIGLLICIFMCSAIFSADPFEVLEELFAGAFGSEDRIWWLLRDLALLLGVGVALIPACKMKFWNLGGNGQVLMGCLVSVGCMYYLGGVLPDGVVNIIMVILSILAGAIWAVIPAIFKAFFKTNESLFTLMMNYIAAGLVVIAINAWVKSGSGTLYPIKVANLPDIVNSHLLTIIVVALLTAFMFIYLKYCKQGFELSIVGESENTAKYVGINVKWVIIRTLVISGAICGIIGLLLGGSINHTVSTESAKNMGFTGIMVAWLAKFNPLMMILTSFLIIFLSKGMGQVQAAFGITNSSVSDIVVAIIYFCIIACEFFINYKVIFKKFGKNKAEKNDFLAEKKVEEIKEEPTEIKEEVSEIKEEAGGEIKEENVAPVLSETAEKYLEKKKGKKCKKAEVKEDK